MTTTEKSWKEVIDGICSGRGWTRQELAARIGASYSALLKWVNPSGKFRPNPEARAKLDDLANGGRAPRLPKDWTPPTTATAAAAKPSKAKPDTAAASSAASAPPVPPDMKGARVHDLLLSDVELTTSQGHALVALRMAFIEQNRALGRLALVAP